MTDIQRKGRHSNILHDMRIVSPWSDAVTNLNYIQILGQQARKGNDAREIGPQVYTDEEERVATINYLKNCCAAREELFIEVVSKVNKKNMQNFQVINTHFRDRLLD